MSIQVIKKPDTVSWDTIHEILWAAHAENRKNGIVMGTTTKTGEELKKKVGNDGYCLVAMDGDRAIGTVSVGLRKRNRWYAHNETVALYMMDGMLPEYQGKGVYSLLKESRDSLTASLGVRIVDMDTAEGNAVIQKIMLKEGFKYVDYASYASDHYSVIMAKWLGECPYSDRRCEMMFRYRRVTVRLKHFLRGVKQRIIK